MSGSKGKGAARREGVKRRQELKKLCYQIRRTTLIIMFPTEVLVGAQKIRPLWVAFSAWVRPTAFSLRHVERTARDYSGRRISNIEFKQKKNWEMKIIICDYPAKNLRPTTESSLKKWWVSDWGKEEEGLHRTTGVN